ETARRFDWRSTDEAEGRVCEFSVSDVLSRDVANGSSAVPATSTDGSHRLLSRFTFDRLSYRELFDEGSPARFPKRNPRLGSPNRNAASSNPIDDPVGYQSSFCQ